jgi:hypothetical protein
MPHSSRTKLYFDNEHSLPSRYKFNTMTMTRRFDCIFRRTVTLQQTRSNRLQAGGSSVRYRLVIICGITWQGEPYNGLPCHLPDEMPQDKTLMIYIRHEPGFSTERNIGCTIVLRCFPQSKQMLAIQVYLKSHYDNFLSNDFHLTVWRLTTHIWVVPHR